MIVPTTKLSFKKGANEMSGMNCKLERLVGLLCEAVAWTLYGLSRVYLAPKPRWTSCIAECTTCGYRVDHNGFPRFPLHRLAREFDARYEANNTLDDTGRAKDAMRQKGGAK